MANVRVVVHDRAIRALLSSDEVAVVLVREAQRIRTKAQRGAPRSRSGSHGRPAGYLASRIVVRVGRDAAGVYADVKSTARTPAGYPYGRVQEIRRPYIRPSIR